MALVEINWKPSEKQLYQFGMIGLVAVPLIGWFYAGRPSPSHLEPWQARLLGASLIIGAVFGSLALLQPNWLKPIFLGLTLLTIPIGFVVSELMLLAMYFLVFAPVAILFRLIGRDALDRNLDRTAKTYWRAKEPFTDVKRYFRQS